MGDKVFVYEGQGSTGKAAVYVEPDTGPTDDPFVNPMDHLEAIEFDTEIFDYMEVATEAYGVEITHEAVTGGTPSGSYNPDPANPGAYTAEHVLVNHNLGFIPFVIVNFNGTTVAPGIPIQALGNSLRLLTVVVTTTQVKFIERVLASTTDLPGGTFEYDVLVFNVPATGNNDFDLNLEPGTAYFKCGQFDSTKRYLRVADSEDTEFRFWHGKTIDLANAVARFGITPSTVLDDATFVSTPAYNYDGSFDASDLVTYEVSVAVDVEYPGETFIDLGENGLKIVDDGQVVLDTSRRLAGIFQIVSLTNVALTFPNLAQDYVYRQRVVQVSTFYFPSCYTWATVVPQEWTNTVELATLDSDKGNFLLGLVKGSRTTNPAQYQTSLAGTLIDVAKLMEENVTIAITGSILLERTFWLRRSVTFAIQGNKLVAILQQSTKDNVDTRITFDPYGLGTYNDDSATDIENPVRQIDNRNNAGVSFANLPPYLEGGANQCTITSSFNFGSVWTFSELKFAIGRITPGIASA